MIWLTVILFILTTLFSIYAAPIREWLSKKYSSNKINWRAILAVSLIVIFIGSILTIDVFLSLLLKHIYKTLDVLKLTFDPGNNELLLKYIDYKSIKIYVEIFLLMAFIGTVNLLVFILKLVKEVKKSNIQFIDNMVDIEKQAKQFKIVVERFIKTAKESNSLDIELRNEFFEIDTYLSNLSDSNKLYLDQNLIRDFEFAKKHMQLLYDIGNRQMSLTKELSERKKEYKEKYKE